MLLDTHIVLWWLADDPTLADDIKDRLDEETGVYVSAASVWEVAIKHPLGKLDPPDLPERMCDSGFRLLGITAQHGTAAARLPMRHRDPFARMLVAQAQLEGLTLVTQDAHVQKHDVDILSA